MVKYYEKKMKRNCPELYQQFLFLNVRILVNEFFLALMFES